MFLPVILVREFDAPGWAAFAIPNVLGAAALPFVLRTPEASERYVARHLGAMKWFSAVTIAFHAMFLTWMIPLVGPSMYVATSGWSSMLGAAGAIAVALAGLAASRLSLRSLCGGALALWAISAALCWLALLFGAPSVEWALREPSTRGVDLLCLAPIMTFGFALCPYLDLTFQRIRRESPSPAAQTSFGFGFGFLFAAMIMGSLMYSTVLIEPRSNLPLLAHFILQSAFTIGVHARELRLAPGGGASRWVIAPTLVGVLVALLSNVSLWGPLQLTSERVYLCILGLYAVAFPAYVWITARRESTSAAPSFPVAARGVWAATTLLTAPMLWLGFIEHRWFWLAPAAVLAVLSRPIALAIVRAKSPR